MPEGKHGSAVPEHGQSVHVSVVSPVYRAKDSLRELYERVRDATSALGNFELVLVDDGSPDESWSVIRELARHDPRVRGVRLSRNFGQHNAITAGLQHARGDWVVVMDCDLQDSPEEIPRLYAKALEGHPCVLARRVSRRDGPLRRLGSRLFYRVFNWLADVSYDPSVANFSIISRRIVNHLLAMGESGRFYGGLLSWLGYADTFVDVRHAARRTGRSSYSAVRLLRFATNVLLSHSLKPLLLVLYAGFGISTSAVLGGLFYLVLVLRRGSPVMGWASLIISIYFATGAMMLTMGVIGLYVGRIFTEVKGRPLYVVRETSFDAAIQPAAVPGVFAAAPEGASGP